MTQQSEPEISPITASFAERLSAFHRSLPPEEQKLLEEILALANRGMAEDDTSGYALITYVAAQFPPTSVSPVEPSLGLTARLEPKGNSVIDRG